MGEDECLERAAGCEIHWKEGMNVTMKTVTKKQKKKGKTRTVKVEEPTDSFFQFFDPPEPPEELEHDYEIGCLLKDKVVPRAVSWFTGAAIDPEEEYDDDDEDEDESDDDEDAIDVSKPKKLATGGKGGAPGPDGEQAECKQQ